MSAQLPDTSLARPVERSHPLSGIAVVFRRQRRGSRPMRELVGAFGLLTALLVLAAGLQSLFFGQVTPYSNNADRFLLRWLTTECIAAGLLMPCSGAILGAGAAPASSERGGVQTALLTRLTAFDVATGRLLAALWSPVIVLLLSCTFWMALDLGFPSMTSRGSGLAEIATAHLILLTALLAGATVGFLCALRRSGRNWGAGIGAGLGLTTICVFGLLPLNPLIRRTEAPAHLIESALAINPVTGVTTALNKDILRVPWIYSRTDAPEYPFSYPAPLTTAALLTLGALTAQGAAAFRMRRLYAR